LPVRVDAVVEQRIENDKKRRNNPYWLVYLVNFMQEFVPQFFQFIIVCRLKSGGKPFTIFDAYEKFLISGFVYSRQITNKHHALTIKHMMFQAPFACGLLKNKAICFIGDKILA
jgi:hypothetical protein